MDRVCRLLFPGALVLVGCSTGAEEEVGRLSRQRAQQNEALHKAETELLQVRDNLNALAGEQANLGKSLDDLRGQVDVANRARDDALAKCAWTEARLADAHAALQRQAEALAKAADGDKARDAVTATFKDIKQQTGKLDARIRDLESERDRLVGFCRQHHIDPKTGTLLPLTPKPVETPPK